VPRQAARDDEQRIDSDVVAIADVARRKAFGGDRDPAQAILVKCPRCRVLSAALLNLDEGQRPAAAGNQIDLAARNPGAAGENSPALETQPPGGERFRPPTTRFGLAAVQLLPASSSARA
jgi:hypothetical protein